MTGEMLALVRRKLAASELDERARDLVLAACQGDEPIQLAAAGGQPQAAEASPGAISPLWLASIAVQGFRGIASRVELSLDPRPGLVVITGRNGTGKSTFAEGLEMVLRGRMRRWEGRGADVSRGWKNVHHEGAPAVWTRFVAEDGRALALNLQFGATATEQVLDGDEQTWAAVRAAVDLFSPLLAYGDLARRLESEPSGLYDAMAEALGLEAVGDAARRLSAAKLAEAKAVDTVEGGRARLLEAARGVDDPRGREVAALLQVEPVDHRRLEVLAAAPDATATDAAFVARVADAPPLEEAVEDVLAPLVAALDRRVALSDSAAGDADRLAGLLAAALAWHHPGEIAPCPLCQTGLLDDDFRDRAERQAAKARETARELREAQGAQAAAEEAVRARLAQIPADDLRRGVAIGLWSAAAVQPAQDLVGSPHAGAALAAHVRAGWRAAGEALRAAQAAAQDWLARREAEWRPVQLALATWLPLGRGLGDAQTQLARLKAAEQWVKQQEIGLRDERFAPIGQEAAALYGRLGEGGHVSLGDVRLSGSATRRKLDVSASVDGADAKAAVGVMSQGELNALALSLFIPRATLPDSPFRFVVLDDPVQALDSAKIDGFARVLDELARARQVIVLTHDPRLMEALRRLRVPTRFIEVRRERRSTVTLRALDAPELQFLQEAHAVADAALPEALKAITVPTLCRYALESVLVDLAWRRGLAEERGHERIAEDVAKARATRGLAALALFGNRHEGEGVEAWLTAQLGAWAATAYGWCNTAGGHGRGGAEDLRAQVRDARRLVKGLQERTA